MGRGNAAVFWRGGKTSTRRMGPIYGNDVEVGLETGGGGLRQGGVWGVSAFAAGPNVSGGPSWYLASKYMQDKMEKSPKGDAMDASPSRNHCTLQFICTCLHHKICPKFYILVGCIHSHVFV